MMKCFPATGHPMDALQSSAASLGLFYSRRAIDDPKYIYNAVIRLIAKIPTMIAAFQLIRKGQDPIQPRDDLTYSSNFLYMLTEKEQDPIAAKVFDRCLILHAEHSLNASTFSARVTASTLTDPYAVIASAVGTLAGPVLGGANEDVIAMLEEIKTPDNAASFLEKAIKIFEDINEDIYNIDRMLTYLRMTKTLSDIAGIGFGSFSNDSCDLEWKDLVKDCIIERLQDFDFPILFDLPIGHISGNACIPLGYEATLNGNNGILSIDKPF